MKMFYALLTLLLTAGMGVQAQTARDTIRPAAGEKPEHARKKMMAELGLTKKQAEQLKEVNADFGPRVKALRADSTLGKMQKRRQLMDLARQREEKLKTFLTAEQMDKLRQLQKEQRQNKRSNKGKEEEEDTP